MLLYRMLPLAAVLSLSWLDPCAAQVAVGGTKADAEHAVQSYLAMWSRDENINARFVARFYAPRVVYYGKSMSRAEVLADKRSFIRAWPTRRYTEEPGSFTASCNTNRSLCRVSAVMRWRRTGPKNQVATGRAQLSFDFVPVDGTRKIARESAHPL